jgi:carnitine monooxygenase subunit
VSAPASPDEIPLKKIRRKLARGAVEYARKGETAVAPAVLHEDIAFYLDTAMFTREEQRLFREMPVVACLSTDLPDAGSYKVFDDTGVPILVTRGPDGPTPTRRLSRGRGWPTPAIARA